MSLDNGGAGRYSSRAALVIGAVLVFLGAVIIWDTGRITVGGGYAGIGPATFPQVIGGGLVVLGLLTVISGFRGSFPRAEAQEYGPMVWIVGGLAAQMLLLNFVGFSIATGVLFGAIARGFGRKPLWLTVLIGIALSFVLWIAFSRLLQLSLPAGPLERLV